MWKQILKGNNSIIRYHDFSIHILIMDLIHKFSAPSARRYDSFLPNSNHLDYSAFTGSDHSRNRGVFRTKAHTGGDVNTYACKHTAIFR